MRQKLSKTNWYIVLKRKCYPSYMRKTCGSVFVVTKIPVSVNLPTYGSPPQCQNVIYAPGLCFTRRRVISGTVSCVEAAIHCCAELYFGVVIKVSERNQNLAINTARNGPGAHL